MLSLKKNGLRFGVWLSVLIALVAIIPVTAQSATQVNAELVIREGARIEASTPAGMIAIIAGPKYERRYEWDRCTLKARMGARVKRWYGSLGIYDPSPSFGFSLFSCNGISRTVVQEGQIHFKSESAAEAWIQRYAAIRSTTTVWTTDGLLIHWGTVLRRSQLNVDLWQVCIRSQRPKALGGSNDRAFTLVHPNGSQIARRECVHVSDEVIAETEKVWAEHWRQADAWTARSNPQKKLDTGTAPTSKNQEK